jgi:hypothetical protein
LGLSSGSQMSVACGPASYPRAHPILLQVSPAARGHLYLKPGCLAILPGTSQSCPPLQCFVYWCLSLSEGIITSWCPYWDGFKRSLNWSPGVPWSHSLPGNNGGPGQGQV